MKTLRLEDTGGHLLTGERIATGRTDVYMCGGEITLDILRSFPGTAMSARNSEAYLSVEQAKQLRKHLKKLIDKAGK
jgi:hypothetical protein